MPVITYTTIIKKFGAMGEKTGWTYVEVPSEFADVLNPGVKTSFRVKGKLDDMPVSQLALLPMGGGDFIFPLNADMRKKLGKRAGNSITLKISLDKGAFVFNADFVACLDDEPKAKVFFETLPVSHQKYFSKWIDSAKTDETKARRITKAIGALVRKMGYTEMIREK